MKTSPASLDTNVLARWIVRDVEDQAERVDTLLTDGRTFAVSIVCLIELEHLLTHHYKFPRHLMVGHLENIAADATFRVTYPHFTQVLMMYATHPALSFVDCYLAVDTEAEDCTPLYTFDRKLAHQIPHVELVTGK